MKTITYNGSSKVIKQIVELLNRKAPLPLDGNGDPNWGTSGQVLATDGSGSTLWVNQGGGGGGGGHTIEDADGTDLTQRANLQFLDAHLADDSVNDRTKVEVVKIVTENEFNALDETDPDNNGIYLFEKSGGTVIDASQVSYGSGTVEDGLDNVYTTGTKSVVFVGGGYITTSGNYFNGMMPLKTKPGATITITAINGNWAYLAGSKIDNPFQLANSSVLQRFDDFVIMEFRFKNTQTPERMMCARVELTLSIT